MGLLLVVVVALGALHRWSPGGIPLRLDATSRRVLLSAVVVHSLVIAGATGRWLVPLVYAAGTVVFARALLHGTQSARIALLGGCGALANLIPIAILGAMPTVFTAGASQLSETPLLATGKHGAAPSNELLYLLGDWIRLDSLQAAVSLGDLAMAAALVLGGFSSGRVATQWPMTMSLSR